MFDVDVNTTKVVGRVSHITVEGEFHKIISAIPLERAGYESATVLHGQGEVLDQPMQVVATEQEDGTTQFTVAVGNQRLRRNPDSGELEYTTYPTAEDLLEAHPEFANALRLYSVINVD